MKNVRDVIEKTERRSADYNNIILDICNNSNLFETHEVMEVEGVTIIENEGREFSSFSFSMRNYLRDELEDKPIDQRNANLILGRSAIFGIVLFTKQ